VNPVPLLLRMLMLIAILATGANALASPVLYFGLLSGAAESPPNTSTAHGAVFVTIDTVRTRWR
jgi:ABC-type enterochelin transport system permease subunit